MSMKKKILTLLMSCCYGILAAQTTGTVVDENKQQLFRYFVKAKIK